MTEQKWGIDICSMTGKLGSPAMSEDDSTASVPDRETLAQHSQACDSEADSSSVTSPNGDDLLPSSVSTHGGLPSGLRETTTTPDQHRSGLTSGPRLHPVHGDRPNSAPPHHLEKVSAVILRTMGDHYQTSSYGKTLRMLGDQMTFESEIRRALSYSDLDILQNHDNRWIWW